MQAKKKKKKKKRSRPVSEVKSRESSVQPGNAEGT